MSMKRKEERRPSESFVMGVVALVFLVIGYQTAVFIHRAAVMKIEADRDHPDTVYIYKELSPVASDGQVRTRKQSIPENVRSVRKIAEHSPRVTAVRENLPRKNVESFRFNPNTVSKDDLLRLGFTAKQAQSIVNYRQKGGKFHRKEDFADSYVVSDSVYRRLEAYIDIPLLDLNLADSADFDALPGIGGWFAAKMVEHRKALKGYSYKEQLMDIWKFDRDRYDALSDLVVVSPENMTPYPFWTSSVDSLRKHPYIRSYETARSIVFYRENNTRDKWTIDGLCRAGVISQECASRLSGCCISSP